MLLVATANTQVSYDFAIEIISFTNTLESRDSDQTSI